MNKMIDIIGTAISYVIWAIFGLCFIISLGFIAKLAFLLLRFGWRILLIFTLCHLATNPVHAADRQAKPQVTSPPLLGERAGVRAVTSHASEYYTFHSTNGVLGIDADLIPARYRFTIPHHEASAATNLVFTTNDAPEHLELLCYLRWIVETNDYTPRRTMEGFPENIIPGKWRLVTNSYAYGDLIVTNYFGPIGCQKEHLDPTEHTETTYVSSNLVSYLVWRGRTNINYLESIPVTTIVHKWHFEKRQIFTQ